jgi:hypothetical protein
VQDTTTMLLGQLITGRLVFTTITIWLQVLLLPQASVISQVSVMNCGQTPLVTMPVELMITLVTTPDEVNTLLQQDEADGRSNVQALPHGTVLFVGQVTTRPRLGLTWTHADWPTASTGAEGIQTPLTQVKVVYCWVTGLKMRTSVPQGGGQLNRLVQVAGVVPNPPTSDHPLVGMQGGGQVGSQP